MKHKNKGYFCKCFDVEISLHFPSFPFQILDIPKKTFPKLYELHTIDFSYNNITEIDRSVFVNLLGLRHLNFTHNHLEQIESSTFGKIPTLLNIDLSYNFLKKVQRGAFGGILYTYYILCSDYILYLCIPVMCVGRTQISDFGYPRSNPRNELNQYAIKYTLIQTSQIFKRK